MLRISLIAFLVLSDAAYSQPSNDVWLQAIRATNYAATVKASFRVPCKTSSSRSSTPQDQAMCQKVDTIPNAIIEAAALPCFKRHLSEKFAQQAIAFWSSSQGAAISKKIVVEIQTGIPNQVTEDELRVLEKLEYSEYGRAFKSFVDDRECSRAVVRAMYTYAP